MRVKKIKSGKWIFALIFMPVILFHSTMNAQTRRAFLVGINNYEPEEPIKKPLCRKKWKNLRGCINDVEAVKGVLISRFYFKKEDIHVLKNEEAARDNILSGIETHLIDEAAPGDMCVFYYAGHGSRVTNSKSEEPDKKDETLVPADWYRGAGDIRDKELKKLFNRVIDKKANLTVIVDACHSGSISRGIPVPLHYRVLPEATCDAADPPDKSKEPAERGALIISACRDFQRAAEIEDENGFCHGLFTWALIKVLRSVPHDEPVGNILLRVNALMASEGIKHKVTLNAPTLEALSELRNRRLFGSRPGKDAGIVAAVVKVSAVGVTLQAGLAAGIRKNCELEKITVKENEPAVRVRVTEVYGLNFCLAEVIRGDAGEIRVGDLFEIDRWVVPGETRMRVWMPGSQKSRFFLQLPLSSRMRKIITSEIKHYNDSIEILTSSQGAQYILVGRLRGKSIEYAWVLANMAREQGEEFAMPVRTEWIAVGNDELSKLRAVNNLRKDLLRLVKIRAWMQLSSPADKGDFPYRLALKNMATGKIKTGGLLMEGETYELVLRAYKEKQVEEIYGRYVYVFSINSNGKGKLLFGDSENYFPASDEFQDEIRLGRELFEIDTPFGVDTLFLLTTGVPITNTEVLEFKGVRREPARVKRYSPLERLLYGLDSGCRGRPPVTRIDWSIQRLFLLSKPREQR